MDLNWRVDFTKGVAVSEAGAVVFRESSPRNYDVVTIHLLRERQAGVSKIGFSHAALRAITIASQQRRR